jgi:hypothetical protein
MADLLVGATALAAAVGGVVAVSARDARVALLGVLLVLVTAPVVAAPLPEALGLGARIVAGLIAVELVWIVLRETSRFTSGSSVGWPVEAGAAAAAFVIGWGAHGLGGVAIGPPLAQGAAAALVTLAVVPLAFGRDVFRLGVGTILLVEGGLLFRASVAGTPDQLEQLVGAALTVGLGGAVAVLCLAAASVRGDFELIDREGVHAEPRPAIGTLAGAVDAPAIRVRVRAPRRRAEPPGGPAR